MDRPSLAFLALCFLGIASCGEEPGPSSIDPQPASMPLTERQTQLWVRSCALCHVDGNAGAPVMGIPEQWSAVIGKSKSELLESVVSGVNDMPPLGYCMACEEDDFIALIDFMTPDSSDVKAVRGSGEEQR